MPSPSPSPVQTSRLVRRLLHACLIATFAAGAITLTAQILPEAPILNFRLPMFSDAGHPVWELRGKEGRYISDQQVDLLHMHLLVFDKDEPNRVETEIVSPAATMFIDERQVRGNDSITVTGDNFIITGQRWLYDTTDRRVEIDEDVKITFFEGLGATLTF